MPVLPRETYDSKCYDLAEAFLSEEPGSTVEDMQRLAALIQGEIEDYIEFDIRSRLKPKAEPDPEPNEDKEANRHVCTCAHHEDDHGHVGHRSTGSYLKNMACRYCDCTGFNPIEG